MAIRRLTSGHQTTRSAATAASIRWRILRPLITDLALISRRTTEMPKQVVKQILPTTMVGSYPRPGWFKHQLLGRDIRVAFKEVSHEEAYQDAVKTVITRSDRGRPRHRDRRQHVVRRLRRRHRLVLLVSLRAHSRLRAHAQSAPVDGQRGPERRQDLPGRLGRRRSTTAPSTRPRTRCVCPTSTTSRRKPPARCPSRCRSAPARRTSPGTSISTTSRTTRARRS